MAPLVMDITTRRLSLSSAAFVTSATWSERIKLKPTKHYPSVPFHLFPDDHFYMPDDADFVTSHTR